MKKEKRRKKSRMNKRQIKLIMHITNELIKNCDENLHVEFSRQKPIKITNGENAKEILHLNHLKIK
jgi:hypothetical protein